MTAWVNAYRSSLARGQGIDRTAEHGSRHQSPFGPKARGAGRPDAVEPFQLEPAVVEPLGPDVRRLEALTQEAVDVRVEVAEPAQDGVRDGMLASAARVAADRGEHRAAPGARRSAGAVSASMRSSMPASR